MMTQKKYTDEELAAMANSGSLPADLAKGMPSGLVDDTQQLMRDAQDCLGDQ